MRRKYIKFVVGKQSLRVKKLLDSLQYSGRLISFEFGHVDEDFMRNVMTLRIDYILNKSDENLRNRLSLLRTFYMRSMISIYDSLIISECNYRKS